MKIIAITYLVIMIIGVGLQLGAVAYKDTKLSYVFFLLILQAPLYYLLYQVATNY